MLRLLSEHGVEFIVVGGVCAVLHGAPIATMDLDVVHSREPENVQRLLRALRDMDARYRSQPDKKLRPTESHLRSRGHSLLLTRFGPLDILSEIGAGSGYDELLPHTVEVPLSGQLTVRILDLTTLVRMKEEAGGEKDQVVLPILRRLLGR